MKTNLPVAAAVFALFVMGTGGISVPSVALGDAPPVPPPASATAAPRPVVRFALRIERAAPVDPSVAPAADAPAPTVLGTPTVTTFDRDTATIAVTNTAFSYALALSPVVEPARTSGEKTVDGGVQTSWNVRLTGKSLPPGNTAVTLTGATRLAVGKNAVLAEISLRDGETGKTTLYRVWATATLPPADAPSP